MQKKFHTILFKIINTCLFVLLFVCFSTFSSAQKKVLDQVQGRLGGLQNAGQKTSDSIGIKHRDDLADSITISFKYLDSLSSNRLDSSLNDFNKFYSVPANYVTLGNNGSPAYPVLFTPLLKAGWDAGFHAFDVYKFTLEDTRFYKTTRPFTQLAYLLASGKEQVINIIHTQNIKPNWNFGFNYRLVSAPGFFQTQNTNHNNYRLFSNYQGNKKRYAAYFVLMGNKLNASENGGIQNDTFLADPNRKKRFAVPVNLGGDVQQTFNIFSTSVNTGNLYHDVIFFLRQSYDFGIKDSLAINDSTEEYLFYPKFRFQHTFYYNSSSYRFKDLISSTTDAVLDSTLFKKWYDTTLTAANGLYIQFQDQWKFVSNDFSIKQFPETKNPAQFIEAGLRLENFNGRFSLEKKSFYNVVLHGEYRNKTRNKKWDAVAKGEFYATGLNAADYSAYATLTRFLNPKLGDVQVIFQNVNRSPSYIFESPSSFNFKNNLTTKKENTTVLSAAAQNPKFTLTARNISLTNYTYFKNYSQTDQFNKLINITQVQAYKKTRLRKRLNLYSDIIVQQTAGNSPIRVPLFYTRERFALEGVYFKNMVYSLGLDVNYNTPYKANNYSPVVGQFFPQDSVTISNFPQVSLYFNFRIKSFTAITRLENLNTINFSKGFSFTNNNFAAPLYPTPGLISRIGVQWNFVN